MAKSEDDNLDRLADAAAPADGATQTLPAKRRRRQNESSEKRGEPPQLPPYNVVLLNDEEHTYEYVIEMMVGLFGHSAQKGYELAKVVDTQGRAIVKTTHKELAELKRDQILGYGADVRMASSRGSMRAVVEPAPG